MIMQRPRSEQMSDFDKTIESFQADYGRIVEQLSTVIVGHRPVIDQTGLKGNYDFKLEWTPDRVLNPDAVAPSRSEERRVGTECS